ncbi:MAG: aspartate aminotransferase family protein [Candidatus Sericytochromatia bacterium]
MHDQELYALRKQHFTHTVNHYYKEPLHLTRAKGTRVWDSTGKEYLDAICGIVSISVGHNHPKIKQALIDRLNDDGIQHPSVLYMSEPTIRLAQQLAEAAPEGLDRVFFSNSGSEANEYAVMAARNITGEETIISLKHGYHGGTLLTTSLCGHSTWKFRAQPLSGVVHAAPPYCYRCPYGKEQDSCALECAKQLEETILTATRGKIAGMIIEPIMGVGGFIDAPLAFLKEAYRICKKYGGMYISDEVQTGIGRTGDGFFAAPHADFTPDMITMAKSLGNGAPIGAVVMSEECSAALAGKLHFNTFGGDPYQTLQASVSLDILAEENLMDNIRARGEQLKAAFAGLKEKHPLVGDVRGRGLMWGLELVTDRQTKAHATQAALSVMETTREHGLLIGKGGLYGNVIRLSPPYTISAEECDEMVRILDLALSAAA